jgi:hypothetical protein
MSDASTHAESDVILPESTKGRVDAGTTGWSDAAVSNDRRPNQIRRSPQRLTSSFAERNHNGACVPMQAPKADLEVVIRGLTRTLNVDGVLVTMPHKRTAFNYCATSSERARLLGVVSVMRRNPDGTWHGDMLDGLAFVKAQKDAGAQPDGARVLLVGAGGPAAPPPSRCFFRLVTPHEVAGTRARMSSPCRILIGRDTSK